MSTYRTIDTGNGEPDVCADADGYLCDCDGIRISIAAIRRLAEKDPDADYDIEGLRDIARRNGLRVIE